MNRPSICSGSLHILGSVGATRGGRSCASRSATRVVRTSSSPLDRTAANRTRGRALLKLICLLAMLGFASINVRAEHFDITLTVEGSGSKAEAHADSSPPFEGRLPRPVFRGHVGELLALQFFMTDANPHDLLERVTVRYYVVPQKAGGTSERTSRLADAVVQGEFLLDFKPASRVGVRQQFRIDHPGLYLLRVESADRHTDHDHFSAIDLRIE
jgi:hypothetical protein